MSAEWKSQLTRNLVGSIGQFLAQRSKLKSFQSEIQDGRHLENLFGAFSPELKGQLTGNLVGSISSICR